MVLIPRQPQRIDNIRRRAVKSVKIEPTLDFQRIRRNPRANLGIETSVAHEAELCVVVSDLPP
ncbi:MAG: hypothetical protein QM784_08145 [Polyangiaceae bacterium]